MWTTTIQYKPLLVLNQFSSSHSVYGRRVKMLTFSPGNKSVDCYELKRSGPRISSWQLSVSGNFQLQKGRRVFSFPFLASLKTLFWYLLQQVLSLPSDLQSAYKFIQYYPFPPSATMPSFTPFLHHKSEYLLMLKISTSSFSIFLIQ